MPRLTIALDEADHMALRLVSIRDRKRLNEVVDDAIKQYLESIGGYELSITNSTGKPATQQDKKKNN